MITQKNIKVGGMSCVRCSAAVEHALKSVVGVEGCTVSYANGRADVTFDDERVSLKTLEKAIKKAGYEVLEDVASFYLLACFLASVFRNDGADVHSARKRRCAFSSQRHSSDSFRNADTVCCGLQVL